MYAVVCQGFMQSLFYVMLVMFILCQIMFYLVKEQLFMYFIIQFIEYYFKGVVYSIYSIGSSVVVVYCFLFIVSVIYIFILKKVKQSNI